MLWSKDVLRSEGWYEAGGRGRVVGEKGVWRRKEEAVPSRSQGLGLGGIVSESTSLEDGYI